MRASDQHRQHRHDQREGQDRGDDQLATQRHVRVALALLVRGPLVRSVALDARVIARALDGADERLDRRCGGIVADRGRLGREVDRRVRAGQPVEDLLDARRAGRAGHSLEREGGLRLRTRGDIHSRIIPYGGILVKSARQASGLSCGNRMTSRIDGLSVSSITSRSMPIPSPAVGGRPDSSART